MGLFNLYVLKKRIFAIRPFMKDPAVSLGKKALVVFGLIYLFLPFDLMPPFVPVLGFLDDAILWTFLLSYLKEDLDRYWTDDRDGRMTYRGKNIVDGVEYTVENEETVEDRDEQEGQEL